MRIYIAAPWVKRNEAIEVGKLFTERGYVVTSRWFQHPQIGVGSTGEGADLGALRAQAMEDLEDVAFSDAVVVLNLDKSEGKAVETGYAMANSLPVISVGPRSNIFQCLAEEVDDVEGALEFLERIR